MRDSFFNIKISFYVLMIIMPLTFNNVIVETSLEQYIILDQSQIISNNEYYNHGSAQSFTTSVDYITSIHVKITGHHPWLDLTLNLRENTINGSIIASKTLLGKGYPLHGWIMFNFSTPVSVNRLGTYIIELLSVGYSYPFSWYYADNDLYEGGIAFWERSSKPDIDFCFKTYGILNSVGGDSMVVGGKITPINWLNVVELFMVIGSTLVLISFSRYSKRPK